MCTQTSPPSLNRLPSSKSQVPEVALSAACTGPCGVSCSGSGEHRTHSAVCSRPEPPAPLLTTGSITPTRIDSICQCQSFSGFLMFDLLRRECARTVNTVCFIIILLCASATKEYYCLTRLWISSFTILCAALWLNVEQYIIYESACAR